MAPLDSVDPERIKSVEVWPEAQALEQGRAQADAPDLEEPRYMSVNRYDATDGGPLFNSRRPASTRDVP